MLALFFPYFGTGSQALWLHAGKLVGDVLLAASFVSYAGPFNMQFRKGLVTEKWLPDLTERGIPMTTGVMPLHMLADDTKKVRFLGERILRERDDDQLM